MQPKTIKSILSRKLQAWVKTISDPRVAELILKDTIITGGAITSLLLGEKPRDYDVYFRTRQTCLAVAEYYLGVFLKKNPEFSATVEEYDERVFLKVSSVGTMGTPPKEDLEGEENEDESVPEEPLTGAYSPVFFTSNAITLSDKIQVVLRFYGEPEEIHENYDFVHCTCYWTSREKELVLPNEALVAILDKRLVYQGSKYPICAMIRTKKFLLRGWKITTGEYLKIAWDVSNIDMTDLEVLQDQLIGVDAAFFRAVIRLFKETAVSQLDRTYVFSVIDRVFAE